MLPLDPVDRFVYLCWQCLAPGALFGLLGTIVFGVLETIWKDNET